MSEVEPIYEVHAYLRNSTQVDCAGLGLALGPTWRFAVFDPESLVRMTSALQTAIVVAWNPAGDSAAMIEEAVESSDLEAIEALGRSGRLASCRLLVEREWDFRALEEGERSWYEDRPGIPAALERADGRFSTQTVAGSREDTIHLQLDLCIGLVRTYGGVFEDPQLGEIVAAG